MTWVRTAGRMLANILDSHSLNADALRAYRAVPDGHVRPVGAEPPGARADGGRRVGGERLPLLSGPPRRRVPSGGDDAALTEAVGSADLDVLPDRSRTLCAYALKLIVRPWTTEAADVEALRASGLSDRDVVDANQVVAYFNYVNRIADGLGVELGADWPPESRRRRRYVARGRVS